MIHGDVDEMQAILTEEKLRYSDEEMRIVLRRKLALSALGVKVLAIFSGQRRRCAVTEIALEGLSAEFIS